MHCKQPARLTCTRCQVYQYCSKDCQKAHWSLHKKVCGKSLDYDLDGQRLTLIQWNELQERPPSKHLTKLSPLQFTIRLGIAQEYERSKLMSFPPETVPLYRRFPTNAFFVDRKLRPMRVIGVIGCSTEKPSLSVVFLDKDSKTYFWIGGIDVSEVTEVCEWDPKVKKAILHSDKPGMFIDPLGYMLAVDLAHDMGYHLVTQNLCQCCVQIKRKASTEIPVLLNHEMKEKGNRRCGQCGNRGMLQKCGRCRNVYYCSVECQSKAWKKHRKNCTSSQHVVDKGFV